MSSDRRWCYWCREEVFNEGEVGYLHAGHVLLGPDGHRVLAISQEALTFVTR